MQMPTPPSGHCRCGYRLFEGQTCPECGLPYAPRDAGQRRPVPRALGALTAGGVIGFFGGPFVVAGAVRLLHGSAADWGSTIAMLSPLMATWGVVLLLTIAGATFSVSQLAGGNRSAGVVACLVINILIFSLTVVLILALTA